MAGHASGERFILIEAATLLPLDLSPAAIGSTIKVMAQGVGDGGGAVDAEASFAGRALRPPAPVHIGVARLADGTIRIGWTRRSRTGWAWLDGIDAPIGEEAERYRLTVAPSLGSPRTLETGSPGHDYSAAEQVADGSAGAATIAITLAQVGSIAASLPAATATFNV